MRHFSVPYFLIPFLAASSLVAGDDVLEAERVRAPDAVVLEDGSASAGLYVSARFDGCTLLSATVPTEEPFEVWARSRGLPLVLKNSEGREIGWLENKDEHWQWESFGKFTRSETGATLDVFMPFVDREMKEGTLPPHPSGIDLLAFTKPGATPEQLDGNIKKSNDFSVPDADIVLKAESGNEKEHGGAVIADVKIDWSRPTVTTSRRQFSLNIFGGFDPEVGRDDRYRENIGYMRPGTLRYHTMSIVRDPRTVAKSWLNEDMRSWNKEKIAAALDALPRDEYERVITIGHWPAWMDADKDGLLDKENYAAFAALCADLVRILNVEQKRGIRYFEITNERDITYWLPQIKSRDPLQIGELAKIYNLCAEAMKEVDPGILTGGPAACRGDLLEPLKQFAILTLPHLDFLSYHAYATGNPAEADSKTFSKAQNLGKNIGIIRRMLDEVSPDRRIELHLNEYNICYTARNRDHRMVTHKGAVYDALVFISMANSGLDVGNAWNDHDTVYGKMDRRYALRPAAHIFHYFNNWMIGQAVETSSTEEQKVAAFAVVQENRKNWVLVNRSAFDNLAELDFPDGVEDEAVIEIAQIGEIGLENSQTTFGQLKEGVSLPPNSVTFFSWAP